MALLQLDSVFNLFRHTSEIINECKGGYIEGIFKFPFQSLPIFLRLSVVSVSDDVHSNMFCLSVPKRKIIDWVLTFRLDQNHSVHVMELQKPEKFSDVLENEFIKLNTTWSKEDGYIILALGKSGIPLNIVVSGHRDNSVGTKFIDSIHRRFEYKHKRKATDEEIKKLSKINVHQIKILLEIFSSDFLNVGNLITPVITNSRSQGPLVFFDIAPTFWCNNGGGKVLLLSHFILTSDLVPVLRVTPKDEELQKLINQPLLFFCMQKGLVINIPPQTEDLLNKVSAKTTKFEIVVKRETEEFAFPFSYLKHTETCFCKLPAFKKNDLPHAKPGVHRRKRKNEHVENSVAFIDCSKKIELEIQIKTEPEQDNYY